MSSCSHFPRPEVLWVRKRGGDKGIRRVSGRGTGRAARGCCGGLGLCVEGCGTGSGFGRSVCQVTVCMTSLPCLWDVIVATVGEGLWCRCGAVRVLGVLGGV